MPSTKAFKFVTLTPVTSLFYIVGFSLESFILWHQVEGGGGKWCGELSSRLGWHG